MSSVKLLSDLLAAIGLVTNFIYQEPSLLTAIQDKGVTTAIMDAIFRKEVCFQFELFKIFNKSFKRREWLVGCN